MPSIASSGATAVHLRDVKRAKLVKKLIPYAFVLPAMLILVAFKLGPIIVSIVGSMYKTGAKNLKTFVFMHNYIKLFNDKVFYSSLWNTLRFNLTTTPIQILIAFVLALTFNQQLKGIKVFRTVFYMPVCVSLSMATMVWALMMNPYNGLLNSFLGLFGIPNSKFLSSPSTAMACIELIATWKGTPYWMMFLLAGMQSISNSVYEAALIDGTTPLQKTWFITIPLMKNSFGFVIVSNTISNMLLFVPMYVSTTGGPLGSTNVLMYEAYKSAYSMNNIGRSYAIVVLLLLVCILVVSIQNKFFKITD